MGMHLASPGERTIVSGSGSILKGVDVMKKLLLVALLLVCGFSWGAGSLGDLTRIEDETSHRASSVGQPWQTSNADNRQIEPGQTLVLGELNGPGEIRHIWFTIAADDEYYPASLVFRIYYDDREEPGVESPLGDFFGVGHGLRKAYQCLPIEISSEGRAYNCFWRMPFQKKARLEVTNESTKRVGAFYYYIDWVSVPSLPHNTAYFHAQYRQEKPCQAGKNYLLLDTEGRGHYVGTVLSVLHAEDSWFGEGDDFIYIDGSTEPVLMGTGTEDYFCDAWGFREFQQMNHGVTIWEGYETGHRGTAYRWHVRDPIRFAKSIRVEIEHMGARVDSEGKMTSGFIERADDYASVAFWYQEGKPRRFAPLPPLSERQRPFESYEIEAVTSSITLSKGSMEVQNGGQWSGGKQVLISATEPEGEISIPFEVKETQKVVLRLLLTKSFDYGIYTIALDDGKPTGPVDLYSPTVDKTSLTIFRGELAAGRHVLHFRNTGASPKSKLHQSENPGYFLGVDAIEMMQIP